MLLPECLSSRDLRIAPSQRASQSRLFAQAGSASRPVSTCTSMNLLWLCYLSWSLQLAADPRKGEIRSYLISTNALTISNMYALRQGWLISLCKRVISTRTNACGYLLNWSDASELRPRCLINNSTLLQPSFRWFNSIRTPILPGYVILDHWIAYRTEQAVKGSQMLYSTWAMKRISHFEHSVRTTILPGNLILVTQQHIEQIKSSQGALHDWDEGIFIAPMHPPTTTTLVTEQQIEEFKTSTRCITLFDIQSPHDSSIHQRP